MSMWRTSCIVSWQCRQCRSDWVCWSIMTASSGWDRKRAKVDQLERQRESGSIANFWGARLSRHVRRAGSAAHMLRHQARLNDVLRRSGSFLTIVGSLSGRGTGSVGRFGRDH